MAESLSIRGRDMDLALMADGAAEPARDEAIDWFQQLRDPLRRYLLCSGANHADAEEAVQEAFLRLHQHLKNNGERSNLQGWIFQVARNFIRDQQKSARNQKTVPLDPSMDRADSGGSPETAALRQERARRLRGAVEKLPAQQRECMLLRSAGLRYREIAQVLGINTNSVGALVQRAVAKLALELTGELS